MTIGPDRITGVILAGGLGRRMRSDGESVDKGLRRFRGRPLIAHAIDALAPQVADLIINANRDLARYEPFARRLVQDKPLDFAGPLAGLASALAAADTEWVLTVPCDSPFLPVDLAARMAGALSGADRPLAVARSAGAEQPVFLLVHRDLLAGLRGYLAQGGRRIDAWYRPLDPVFVDFEDAAAFVNINTPDELRSLE